MDPAREALIALSAALAAGDAQGRERALERASEQADPSAVEEVILQSHLFLGYPVALNALGAWRSLSGREAPGGPEPLDASERRRRGEAVCRAVYGDRYEALRDAVRRLHPDLDRWMVDQGYGTVLGRSGLGLVDRELCIAALLAVLDAPRQLLAHLRGALNVGADPLEVARALELAGDVSDPISRARAARTWESVRARANGGV